MPENFKFEREFQDSIIAHFIAEPDRFLCYGEVLLPSYFEGAQSTIVAYALFNYLKQYGKVPGWPTLKQFALDQNKKLSLATDDEVLDYVTRLREIDTSDGDFVVSKVIAFARERATVNAIKKAIELIKEGKTPEDGFTRLFQEATAVGQNLEDLGLLFHADYEQVIRTVTKSDYGTSTGYRQWDKIWPRGWGPGWLIVFLAPPKRYKTGMCLNIALNVISPMIEGDVLYYPCEITQELAFTRALNNITRKGMSYVYNETEKFIEAAGEAIKIHAAGNLIVKGYPAGTATLTTIRNHARMAIKHFNIKKLKAIVIDYADTVLPSEKYDAEYLKQAAVYTEARALGAEFKCPIILPDRMTKDATDKKVPDMKAFQGAYAKGGIVDVAIGMCMTEEEYQQNILRTFVFVNRHGQAFQHFRGKVDPETMWIDIGEEIPYDPDDNDGSSSRRKGLPSSSRRERKSLAEGEMIDEP
jgi:hypothetical protein